MPWPVVFDNISNMNDVIRMATTGPFSVLFVLQTHIYFQDGPKASIFREGTGQGCSQMLCATPAGCFAMPVQQKVNLILQSGIHCRCVFVLDFYTCEKEGSQRPFF